ncbi:MAG: helix-hairpin-helix domain-containing protein [Thermacetogeniaceae bacterium]
MWEWDRKIQGIVLLFAAALVFACGVKYAGWRGTQSQKEAVAVAGAEESDKGGKQGISTKEVAVHVAGAVNRPGVYYFKEGSRVIDAVERAGPLPEADLDSLNLAQPLADGVKIYVPKQGEAPQAPGMSSGMVQSSSPSYTQGSKVNINTASAKELDEALPGIGPTLAQRIVEYREQHGPFRSVEDIKNVSGIGERRFEQIKDLITI